MRTIETILKRKKLSDKLDRLISKVPREYRYWKYLKDQDKWIKATNRFSYKWLGFEFDPIFEKYKYIGIPIIYPNYKNIKKDFPKIRKLMKKIKKFDIQ